uniref:Ryanodine receptor n=1 Tax=Romanomermis culicivorax TaxID=13658 RepID=A0A915J8H5_ROMCU
MLHSLSTNVPHLQKLLDDIDHAVQENIKYANSPNIFDIDLPLICSYLHYWWDYGTDCVDADRQLTNVNSQSMNRVFVAVLKLLGEHIGEHNGRWLCRVASFGQKIIAHVTCDPMKDYFLPVTQKLRAKAEYVFREEERLKTHPDDVDEGLVAEVHALQVRDTYAFFPLLMKYTDLHRAQWLKCPSSETDEVYANVAIIFSMWSHSQHFKREELNFMAQFEDESGPGAQIKTGKAAIAERKKKRREGKVRNKESGSVVVQCFKRLLPVGLNVFGGRELDIVQHCKEKFLQKENDEKIRDFIRAALGIPERTDPTDKNVWQRKLYNKIGKSQMRDIDALSQESVVEHPQASLTNAWKKVVSTQRKRAVVACFRMVALYTLPAFSSYYFLPFFSLELT